VILLGTSFSSTVSVSEEPDSTSSISVVVVVVVVGAGVDTFSKKEGLDGISGTPRVIMAGEVFPARANFSG
jgi:hypothetical protein